MRNTVTLFVPDGYADAGDFLKDCQFEQAGCHEERIEQLREAMAVFAEDTNWRLNGPLDPNSAKFRGTKIARDALFHCPSTKLRTAVESLVETFEKDEAQGYRSKDRQYAISILRSALS